MVPILVLLLAGAARAQDGDQERYDVQAWRVDSWKEADGTEMSYLSGQVRITSRKMDLRADRVLTWKRPLSASKGSFDELYAEGFVRLKNESGITEVERLYMDLVADRALAVEFVFRGQSKDPPTPFQVRAKEVVRLSGTKYVADQAMVSSCIFATPHFDVRLSKAVVSIVTSAVATAGRAMQLIPRASDVTIQGDDVTASYEGFPFFYFPGFTYQLGSEFLLRRVTAGESRRFGWFLYTDWGFSLYRTETDHDLEHRVRWGEFEWKIDWREKRDWAAGLFPKWYLPWMTGYVSSYGLYDPGPNPDSSFDRQFLPLIQHERGRARLFDRLAPSDDWRVDLELSFISDRNMLPEFFREEFLTGKEQETTVYVRWREANLAAVGQAKYRVNDFQSQVEQMPRAEFYAWGEPAGFLIRNLHYSQNTQEANLRFLPDVALLPGTFQTWRFDTQHEFFIPVDLGFVQVNPFGLVRYTEWEHDIVRKENERYAMTAGADLSTTISGVYEFRSETFGMHDLRHIVHARTSYANNLDVTEPPSRFFAMDRRDALAKFEEVSFELRQHFQTKIGGKDGERIHEFLKVTGEIEYYPQTARDTAGVNQNSFTYPFNWLAVTPTATSLPEIQRFSNLWWTAAFTPAWILSVQGVGEVNIADGADIYRNISIGVAPLADFSVTLGHTYLKHATNSYLASMIWNIPPHWSIAGSMSYDFRQEIFTYSQVDIIRTFHDMIATCRFSYDAGQDDLRILVIIQPKIFR